MNELITQRLIYSGVLFLFFNGLLLILKQLAKQTQRKLGMRQSRYFAMRRIFTISAVVAMIAGLFFIWGLNLKNVWITATSALAVVAIAFFAVWSLVGNILAGTLLFFTSPFKIDDYIEVMPEEIRGQVMAINTFYTVLLDENLNYINIPNSLFFQKFIRVKSKQSSSWGPSTDSTPDEKI